MDWFFMPFRLFVDMPPLAFLPAVLFANCYRRSGQQASRANRRWLFIGSLSWLTYAVWECYVWLWSQDVTAPIRVDILILAPVLYAVSFFAVLAWWRNRNRGF